ncbi:cache domain-containing protein [bacterium]|nr:cache domain-containing protein [bacterium]
MKIPLKTRLVFSFILVVVICGAFATWVGVHLINSGVVREAQKRVDMDLNSANEIYNQNIQNIETIVRLTAIRIFIKEALLKEDKNLLQSELNKIRVNENLDVLNLIDKDGRVLIRTSNPPVSGDTKKHDPLVKKALENKKGCASTLIIPSEDLLKDGQSLAERAHLKIIPTPFAEPTDKEEETSGMMIAAVYPIINSEGDMMGILYGGKLINRDYNIVDKVKEIVFKNEQYKGKEVGTVTIFQKDLRISTNVVCSDGSRAIGTRVSEEVRKQVLEKGESWFDRAFVVDDWYISAYEPIYNLRNEIIGILYVGILEDEFSDLRRKTLLIFLAIILIGILVSIAISYLLGNSITKPIRCIFSAAHKIAEGDFNQKVFCGSGGEIGELAKAFNMMTDSIKERDEKLKEYATRKIAESERLAMVGHLAAGVAHEINNPLGSILIYSNLILEDLTEPGETRDNLTKIVTQATRCKKIVKGLLDFARQTEPEINPFDINGIIKEVLSLIDKQSIFQNIRIITNLSPNLPQVMVDKSQIQQVFMNIILNAAEAMSGNGRLTIHSHESDDKQYVVTRFTDTGCGIPPENIKRIFEPFFTLKAVGQGTGLGLAISYGIVKKHNGTITVESEIDKGTTFTISIPVQKA